MIDRDTAPYPETLVVVPTIIGFSGTKGCMNCDLLVPENRKPYEGSKIPPATRTLRILSLAFRPYNSRNSFPHTREMVKC
ncbi:hypothetical protein TNCV_917721 [Trichonephila clavipes]|nr:hypothetical protein TNCV_917721 [Trichonephila clavipes]